MFMPCLDPSEGSRSETVGNLKKKNEENQLIQVKIKMAKKMGRYGGKLSRTMHL